MRKVCPDLAGEAFRQFQIHLGSIYKDLYHKGPFTQATGSPWFRRWRNASNAVARVNAQLPATVTELWVITTSNSLSKYSKFGNQLLITATGAFVWTSSCWNLARFHHFAAFYEEINTLFWFTVAECLNTQSLVAQPPAIHASLQQRNCGDSVARVNGP